MEIENFYGNSSNLFLSKIFNNINRLLLKIKIAQVSYKKFLIYKNIGICNDLLDLLWNNGYIVSYRIIIIYNIIRIDLKYLLNKPIIRYVTSFTRYNAQQDYNRKQISMLSLKVDTLFFIIYTKLGIKTLEDCKKQNLSGKLLAIIC